MDDSPPRRSAALLDAAAANAGAFAAQPECVAAALIDHVPAPPRLADATRSGRVAEEVTPLHDRLNAEAVVVRRLFEELDLAAAHYRTRAVMDARARPLPTVAPVTEAVTAVLGGLAELREAVERRAVGVALDELGGSVERLRDMAPPPTPSSEPPRRSRRCCGSAVPPGVRLVW